MEGAGVPAPETQLQTQLQPRSVHGGKGHGKGPADLNSTGFDMQINRRMFLKTLSGTFVIVWEASLFCGDFYLGLAGWLPGEEVGPLGQPSRKMSRALTDGPVPSGPNGFKPLAGTTGGEPNFSHLLARGDK